MPQFEDLYPVGASQEDREVEDATETATYDLESPAIILHSSGTYRHTLLRAMIANAISLLA